METLRNRPVDVVITDRDLLDGGWADVLSALAWLGNPPRPIVMARFADERLWADTVSWTNRSTPAKRCER
jgi:hypothetical protein